jgi:beta-glucosidase
MKHLGLDAYRFSIAWPRIQPLGRGRIESRGLDFYKRLTDGLLEAGITPFATLYHWDLPQALQEKGGWTNPDVARWFADYATLVFEEIGDRIPFWITLNEPWCSAVLGYMWGVHAPGIKDLSQTLLASKNLLLAHGLAVQRFREIAREGKIGITLNMTAQTPASDREADIQAVERGDAFNNWWFADPIFHGHWPQVLLETLDFPRELEMSPEDWRIVQEETDFLGLNYYTRAIVKNAPDKDPLRIDMVRAGGAQHTEMDWEVYPKGLYDLLDAVRSRYDNPAIYITENGAAFPDQIAADGKVHDQDRIEYLRQHFEQARRYIESGGDLRGYLVWSLMDNFEWAFGYSKRFGLVQVDYQSLKRTPKASADWYRRFLGGD